jgi:predicted nucleic acid-binding protein
MSTYYFDTSALVKLYIPETGSFWVDQIVQTQDFSGVYTHQISCCKIGIVEVAAVVARREREGKLNAENRKHLFAVFLNDTGHRIKMIAVTDEIIRLAADLTQRAPLRAYDAVHLATALTLNDYLARARIPELIFISADQLLLETAHLEGLKIENPNSYP